MRLDHTDRGIYAWNGRRPNRPAESARLQLDWEYMAGGGVRIATGPDGCPWVVNAKGGVWRLVAAGTATAEFTTADAGKVTGTAVAAGGSLFQGEWVSINGSTDLSKVIIGPITLHQMKRLFTIVRRDRHAGRRRAAPRSEVDDG